MVTCSSLMLNVGYHKIVAKLSIISRCKIIFEGNGFVHQR